MANKVAVIGAGIGGLATALRLNALGFEVTVYEKNEKPGGKAFEIKENGFRFDTGPSLFTMPFVLERLFTDIGVNINKYLNYQKLDNLCRYYFPDNTIINAYADTNKFAEEIAENTIDDKESVNDYLDYSKTIYRLTNKIFLNNSLTELSTYLNYDAFNSLLNLRKIDTNRTMNDANRSFFKDEKTIQIFNRYATYNGSNPFKAPATLNIIPYVENGLGGYYLKGGIYSLPKALEQIGKERGVKYIYNADIDKIVFKNNKVYGIKIKNDSDSIVEYDIVVSNSDVMNTYSNLIEGGDEKKIEKYKKLDASSSAVVFYWGIKDAPNDLNLHNILFSKNYQNEFDEIFTKKIPPIDPTVYIYISSKAEKDDAPDNCENWFVMINVPYDMGQNWNEELIKIKERILSKIEAGLGLNIRDNIIYEKTLTPKDIEITTNSYKGALYGISSNNKTAAFLREQNRSSKYKGLYFVGGSAHPGGGIPLVMLSAQIATDLIKKYEKV